MDWREVGRKWFREFDEAKMLAYSKLEDEDGVELVVPCEYAVCSGCEGRGVTVNPAIDSHGISPEEFAEDPDFAEAYFSGQYDIPCPSCGGKRVVPIPVSEEHRKLVASWEHEEWAYYAECEAERRMGA